MAPGSDLDLLLLYDRRGRINPVAEAMWYPVWDAGVHLDHSVRTPKEVRAMMEDDIKVALGLLDARLVAGDQGLAGEVLTRAMDLWQTRAGRWLPAIDETTRDRHRRFGDLAFLLEPDLKEARGGQRDLHLLRSLGRVFPVLAGRLDDPDLTAADEVLVGARVELHRGTGRATNTLLLQDQDATAAALGYADADELMAALAGAGRRVAWANDDGWRRLESWLAGPARRASSQDRPLEPGLVLRDDEVTLLADAPVDSDPSLALRAAAVSAELDLPLARATLDRLASDAVGRMESGRPRRSSPWCGCSQPGARPSPPSRPLTSPASGCGTSRSGRRSAIGRSATPTTASPSTGIWWRRRRARQPSPLP